MDEEKLMLTRLATRAIDGDLVNRVASRAIQALSVGKTFESDKWRVHRYRDSLAITHLENAGKRGKKCVAMGLDFSYLPGDALLESIAMDVASLAKKNVTPEVMEKHLREVVSDFQGNVKLNVGDSRGVDVVPAGFGPMEVRTKNIEIRVKMDGFSVRDMSEAMEREIPDGMGGKKKVVDYPNMPTCIPESASKKGLASFYRWVKDNESKLKTMKYQDVINAIKDLGIPYHTYCAMD
jgi:hypothetical protein